MTKKDEKRVCVEDFIGNSAVEGEKEETSKDDDDKEEEIASPKTSFF